MKKLTDIEKSYLAGVIDGEGTITLVKANHLGMKDGVQLRPSVFITGTNYNFIEYTKNLMGGYLYVGISKEENHRDKVVVKLDKSQEILLFLEQIHKFLFLKRKQAELIIEFININPKFRNGKSEPASYLLRQFEIYEEIRFLNSRGK